MEGFWRLLSRIKDYKRSFLLSIASNILLSVFTVVSIPLLIPFFQILFGRVVPDAVRPQNSDINEWIKYYMSDLIDTYGKDSALLLVCVLLVVVFFENTVLHEEAYKKAETVKDIYINTLAQQFLQDKRTIAQILQNYGIQTILTTPENLSINTLNKYLELKARGLI